MFLADGTPDGIRIVTKSNWTGRVLVSSRSDYPRLRQRDELGGPGVYVLMGPSERSSKQRIYVGEADELVRRLDQHARGKDFWSRVLVCVASDDSMNKALIRYLEWRLIGLASEAEVAELENANAGAPVRLSESDTEDAETYLDELLVLLPVIGLGAFETVEDDATATSDGREALELTLHGPRAAGAGFDRADGFLVKAGARARIETVPSIPKWGDAAREELVDDGTLVLDGDSYVLTKSQIFSSPSLAAVVLLGRSANGRTEWKDSNGRTLAAIQEAALESSDVALSNRDIGVLAKP